jgi:RNA 2',3'-cyclic 3'-phosphodiesterase
MRLFVGIELDAVVVRAAADLIDELVKRTGRRSPGARVAWVTPDRLHVTVRFIGHKDDAEFARIRDALEPSIAVEPFPLTVHQLGSFPPRGTPRVIWAGIGGDEERLRTVEQEVTERLSRVGVPPDTRPYSPHLTLGRVKEADGLNATALFRGLTDLVLGTTAVEAITLFESRVSSKGPTYVPLQRTTLTRT